MNKTMLPGNALTIRIMLPTKFPIQLLQPIFSTVSSRQKPNRRGQSAILNSTPNDRPRGPPKTSDDERVDRLREEVRKRFENRLKKEKTHDVSSTSESEQAKAMPKQLRPATPIQAKAMPKQRQQKGTARTVSSAAASDSKASASRTAESSARDERGKPVKGSVAKRETSTQAKELFKDADAAKKIFTKFKQETEAIEWYQRPPGPQCCKNFETCNAEDAMFWCHPCGLAYCLDCRVSSLACDHHIVNYFFGKFLRFYARQHWI